ncbi:hypothetical protein B0H14DRAFT_367449 [Mycena olivaceomarginata]|nr:hypothetical protein B0H14DRAFT_367449 [Mycena olivaceomarginata]
MTPFECPTAVVSGLKEKITSLAAQDDRLYVGTTTGKLILFWIDENASRWQRQDGNPARDPDPAGEQGNRPDRNHQRHQFLGSAVRCARFTVFYRLPGQTTHLATWEL